MWNSFIIRRPRTLAATLTALLLFGGPALRAQDDARAIAIRWTPVARATGYQIQVRDQGGAVLHDRRLRATVFEPRLEPGTYLYRIAALGKNGKAGQFSPWLRVLVKPTRTPEIGRVVPKEDTARGKRIEVSGEGFLAESKAFLVRPGSERVALPTELINENTIYVYVAAALLGDGEYDIVVENPRGLKEEREEAITIERGQVKVDRSAQRGARRVSADEVVPAPDPAEKLDALWRSALVPGWGQYEQGRPLLALGVLGAQTTSIQARRARTKMQKDATTTYRNRLVQGFGAQVLTGIPIREDVGPWLRLRTIRNARFNRDHARMQHNTAGMTAAGVYFWNLLDVALYAGQGEATVTRSGALWRSAVLPGWGQYASGRPLAGAVYSGSFIAVASAGGAHATGLNEMRKLSADFNLQRIWTTNFLTGQPGARPDVVAVLHFRDAQLERRRLTEMKRERDAAGALLGAIYLANIADHFVPWEAFSFGGGGESAHLYIGPADTGGLAFGLSLRY